jgi:uncharacterized membrane protein
MEPMRRRFLQAIGQLRFSASEWRAPFKEREDMIPLVLLALPALRVLAALTGVIVLARIAWEPRIVGGNVGATPIFNWLLYGYGIPAAAFWLGGHLLRRRGDDVPARMIDSGAIVLTVLLAFLEIRHFMNAGDVYRPGSGLAEVALQICVGLAMAIGIERLRQRTNSFVHDIGALAIAALAFAAIVLGLAVGENPLFTGEPVGGRFINLVLLAYAVPAMLAAALALLWRATRPPQYSAAAAVTAVALALGYLSLQVRTLFRGEVLTRGSMTDAEQYTYSVVWLAFGVILLAAGVGIRSSAVRFSSAAVVIMAVLKVFLVDMRLALQALRIALKQAQAAERAQADRADANSFWLSIGMVMFNRPSDAAARCVVRSGNFP